jgi:hypothetical protein
MNKTSFRAHYEQIVSFLQQHNWNNKSWNIKIQRTKQKEIESL